MRLFIVAVALSVLLISPLFEVQLIIVEINPETGTNIPEWESYYENVAIGRMDSAKFIVHTNDGGYAIAGDNYPRYGTKYVAIVKTDSSGTMQWSKMYDLVGLSGFAYTSDGGYVLLGHLNRKNDNGFVVGTGNATFLKTDPNGEIERNQTYPFKDCVNLMIQTRDGGYAFVGTSDSKIWLVKTDSDGKQQWEQTHQMDLKYRISLAQMVQSNDGGYALAATGSSDSGAGGTDFVLFKMSPSGDLLWSEKYGGADDEDVKSLVQTRDGGYALVGSTTSFGLGGPLLIKTDAAGNMEWARTYGSKGTAQYLIQATDGGLVFVGQDYRVLLVKTDSLGNVEWNHTYGSQKFAEKGYLGRYVVENKDSSFTVAGCWMATDSVVSYYMAKTQPIPSSSTVPSTGTSPNMPQTMVFPKTIIDENGNITPVTAPIRRDGNVYTLTADLMGPVVVERDNIIIDGKGYALHGNDTVQNLYIKLSETGVSLTCRTNVTVKNLRIFNYTKGISLDRCTNITILANTLTQNKQAIFETNSTFAVISANDIKYNYQGIGISESLNNKVTDNNISNTASGVGLSVEYSSSNIIYNNTMTSSDILFEAGSNNLVTGNNIYSNFYGIFVSTQNSTIAGNNFVGCQFNIVGNLTKENNLFYMNNFENGSWLWFGTPQSADMKLWDNGTVGNYYGNYIQKYPNASEIDHTGTWNTPYDLESNNTDYHPLVSPVSAASMLALAQALILEHVLAPIPTMTAPTAQSPTASQPSLPSASSPSQLTHTNPPDEPTTTMMAIAVAAIVIVALYVYVVKMRKSRKRQSTR